MLTVCNTGVTRTFHEGNPSHIQEEFFSYTGVAEGVHRMYDEKGNLKLYSNYVGGLLEGEYREYTNTILTAECVCVRDNFHGEYRAYYETGGLYYKVNYIDGKRNGLLTSYHPNGQLYESYHIVDDKMDGHYSVYDKNGVLYKEMHYTDGLEDGECRIYNMYGLAETIPYSKGKIDGVLHKYDEFGNETRLMYYKDCCLISCMLNNEGTYISRRVCLPIKPDEILIMFLSASLILYYMAKNAVMSLF